MTASFRSAPWRGPLAVIVLFLVAGASGADSSLAPDSQGPHDSSDAARLADRYQLGVSTRLRFANDALAMIAIDMVDGEPEPAMLEATEGYFDSVVYISPGKPATQLTGRRHEAPLEPGLTDLTVASDAAIVVSSMQAEVPEGSVVHGVSIVRYVRGAAIDGGKLIARVAPAYLWESAAADAGELCVRDKGGAMLHCTSQRAQQALSHVDVDLAAASGTLSWPYGSETLNGAYARLTPFADYLGGDWTVQVVAAPPVASGWSPRVGATSLLVSAMLVVACVVWYRHRTVGRTTHPADGVPLASRETRAADQQPALQRMLERQTVAIRGMSDIDRASLSRAAVERVLDLAAQHLLACTGCDVLLVGVVDHGNEGSIRLSVAEKGGTAADPQQHAVDASVNQLLSLSTDGAWVHKLDDFELLSAQKQRGVKTVLLLPIFEDATPVGFASIGFAATRPIDDEESNPARAIVDRLSAALTAAAHAKALHEYTYFDATTSLPNRRFLKEHLEQQMKSTRRDRVKLAVLFIGLDSFKKVNARWGHGRGDEVLAEAARRIRRALREEDLVTRFGGDVFVAVLRKMDEAIDARKVADKLLEALAQPFDLEEERHYLGCSIGICVYPDDAQSCEGLLRSADQAMFEAKAAGRNGFMFFDTDLNRAAVVRNAIERDLRVAIANSQFIVMYQPQVDLRSGLVSGVEALVRWQHPTRGLVQPSDFIPLAEEANLIGQIDEMVMRTACTDFLDWEAEGIAPLRISVNVTGQQIARDDFVARIERIVRETGMRPMFLELEITEGVYLEDSIRNIEKLNQIHQRGVRIALDDFGTGYSSLSYLKRLPIDVVKIDRSFINDITGDPDASAIVRAILQVAHTLSKSTVAEGVETDEQRALLHGLNCDVGQGYLWSRPLPAQEFAAWCRNRQVSVPKAAVEAA